MSPYPNDNDDDDLGDVEDIGLAPGESAEGEKPGATTIGVAGYNVDVDNRALPYVSLVAAAIILLIALLVPEFQVPNEAYGISVCAISMILGLFGIYMTLMNHGLYENPLGTFPMVGDLTWGTGMANFLFLWNFVGASILTFDGPFTVTSNGYFASWGLVLFSLMALGVTTEAVRSQASTLGKYNGLLVATIIQLCAIIPEMGSGNGRATYSLVLCILTIMAVLAFGAYPIIDPFKLPIFALFSILWLVMACLVTFKGPFVETGNGYFSAWMGCVLAVMIAASLKGGSA